MAGLSSLFAKIILGETDEFFGTAMKDQRIEPDLQTVAAMLVILLCAKNYAEALKTLETSPGPQMITEHKPDFLSRLSRAIAESNVPLTTESFAALFHNSGLMQSEMAAALSVDQSDISKWLSGVRAVPQKHAAKIRKLCSDGAAKRVTAIFGLVPKDKRKAA
jgi:DNA-binding transcriptional regulator YiaG